MHGRVEFSFKRLNGLVQKNDIHHIASTGILLTTDAGYFEESGQAVGVAITSNSIRSVGASFMSQAANQIDIGAISLTAQARFDLQPRGYSPSFLHRNNLIEYNTIRSCTGPAVFLSSDIGTTVTNNTFSNHTRFPFSKFRPGERYGVSVEGGYGDAVYILHSKRTTVKDNTEE